jgi:hypothetical protein
VLRITVVVTETFDEETSEFAPDETFDLTLEHSLFSLSKWESQFEKPFLSKEDKTREEMISYVKIMTTTPEVPEGIFAAVSQANIDEISAYVDSKQSAARFAEKKQPNNQIITAEDIYYWMIAFQIPFECQHWHLNRLLALVRTVQNKQAPPDKLSKSERLAKQRELNDQRRKEMGTKG